MILWLLALAAGLALAALSYRLPAAGVPRVGFALRALAGACVVAVALDAPLGAPRPVAPWVAVDVSASWLNVPSDEREGRWARVGAVVDSLRSAGADSVLLFGAAVRGGGLPAVPGDSLSSVEPAVETARALGRPLAVVTDGALDDADRLALLPRGSSVIVIGAADVEDVAVAGVDAPAGAVAGDTVEVRVTLRAGAAGGRAGRLVAALGARALPVAPYEVLPAFGERELIQRLVIPAAEGVQRLSVRLETADAVPENDSASVPIEVTRVAAAAVISTAPDQDARYAFDVLRGTRRGAVRGYWRVAPGQWRVDGTLLPVAEDVVRRALREAAVVVLHGDTAYFGAPRTVARGAVVLMAPATGNDDYYATSAGDSPLLPLLSDLPWDSLSPLRVAASRAPSGYRALLARRARRLDERTVVVLQDGPRRGVVVAASGLWRWRTRGGRGAQAFDAVWGSIFDWVGAERRAGGVAGGASRRAGAGGEWVPRAATVAAGPVGDGPVRDLAPRARGAWWLVVLAVAALCVEWVLRRRIGWR